MHRTRFVCVSFVLLFTTVLVTHVANVVSFMNGRKDALVVWNTR